MPEDKHDYNLTTQVLVPLKVSKLTPCSFFPLFSSYIYNLLTDEASIRFTTTSVLTDFMNDGVVYLELRTTPRASATLSAGSYITILLSTIAMFEAEHPKLHTRLILSIDRRHTPETASSILNLATAHSVVGLDLCGDPAARPNGDISIFTPTFLEAKTRGLGITVHFAEAEASASPAELRTLLSWMPDRLGHVIWEDEETKREIARRGLCLELCLSCNVKAGMVSGGFEGHHFGEWTGVDGPRISLGVSPITRSRYEY